MLTCMRAAVYVRQSKDAQLTGLAVARQREDCLKLCQANGWTIVEVFEENDTSASGRKPRPVYERMMRAADAGAFDVIVAWHVDRLTRRLTDLEDLISRTRQHSVRIATVNGELDLSNDTGRLVGRILASVAAGEVERKSARQKRAAEQAAERGLAAGGPRPFGFNDDRTTIREDEAEALRGAYRDFIAGRTLSGVARDLNEAGFTTTRGGPWRHNSMRSTLVNPRNAGLRSYGPVGPDGRVRERAIIGEASWPAIVDQNTWQAACALLADPARATNKNGGARRWLLTGIALCGACGEGAETRVICTYRDNGRRAYRCSERAHLLRRAEPIDELVVATTIARLSRPDARDLLSADSPDGEDLRGQATALRARLDGLAGAYAEGVIDLRQLHVGTSRLRAELQAVESKQAATQRGASLFDLVHSDDVCATWDGLSLDRQRAAIEALWRIRILNTGPGRRVFDPTTVEIVPADR